MVYVHNMYKYVGNNRTLVYIYVATFKNITNKCKNIVFPSKILFSFAIFRTNRLKYGINSSARTTQRQ